MPPDPLFVHANHVEAALWAAFALVVLLSGRSRSRLTLATALLLFGISDLVEARTGAWYRPWWLLTWKAACLAVMLALGILYKSRQFRAKLSMCSR
jgi:hypothetical protein